MAKIPPLGASGAALRIHQAIAKSATTNHGPGGALLLEAPLTSTRNSLQDRYCQHPD
jgi:hypothetical protein